MIFVKEGKRDGEGMGRCKKERGAGKGYGEDRAGREGRRKRRGREGGRGERGEWEAV